MAPRTRVRLGFDDTLICQRMGYSSLTPQACLDKHVRNDEACGDCRQHRLAAAHMAEATDSDPEHVYQLVRHGQLSQYGNPIVRPESLPDHKVVIDDEKGTKTMNTRIIFINGRRMPQGVIVDFKQAGGLAERSLVAFFVLAFFTDAKIEPRDIAIDEYVNGRLQTRYEWSSSDKTQFGEPITSKINKAGKEIDVLGFRMYPIATDNYTRG